MSLHPDRHDPATLGESSRAVHAGNIASAAGDPIRTPIVMANSYALPEDPTTISWSGTDTPLYTRNSGTNQLGLQRKLASLEHAEDAVVLASGVAALHALFFTTLSSGDHVVATDIGYVALRRLLEELLPRKYGVTATFVDTSDPAAVEAAIKPETRLIHTEAIANPTTRVADIAALAQVAHRHGALLSVDSTFTPPGWYRPLEDGADLVVHSLTKYINGHGDALGGAVLGREDLIAPVRADAMVDVGGIISPFNAWLIMRGSVTLPLRLRQHAANAQALAERLESDPRVALVHYPGLASHPQHEVAAREFPAGAGAMIAFSVQGGPEVQNRFVSNLRLITSAVSLGHDESLIAQVSPDEPHVVNFPRVFQDNGLLRLSIGIEDTDDLLADVGAALDATFPARS
jgi:methionine-gamma-lyase